MEMRQTVSASEQNRLVDDWLSRRPVKPVKIRFVYKKQFDGFWMAIPMLGNAIRFARVKRKREALSRELKESGWPEYELAMSAWRLETRTFFKWWPTNDHVNDVLIKSYKDTHVL